MDRNQEVAQETPNPNTPVLLFFHIPLPEFRELLLEEDEKKILGDYQEKVWHSGVNGGLYAAAIDHGNVKGMFVGHDHVNDFCFQNPNSKIPLCYCGVSGYGELPFFPSITKSEQSKSKQQPNPGAYSRTGWPRRVRLIEFKPGENGSSVVETWKRLDGRGFPEKDRQILGETPPDGRVYLYLPFEAWMALAAGCGAAGGAILLLVLQWCWGRRKLIQRAGFGSVKDL